MKFYGDYHTHTTWSDGKGSIKQNLRFAELAGLQQLAITEHGLRNPSYNKKKLLAEYEEVNSLHSTSKVELLFGIEADILNENGEIDVDQESIEMLDLLIVGFHMFSLPDNFRDYRRFYIPSILKAVTKSNVVFKERNTDALVSCITNHPVDMLSHPNHRLFADMREVAKACYACGTLVELNIKHLNSIIDVIDDFAQENVEFIVNSDAHRPQEVGDFEKAEAIIRKYGLEDRVVNLNNPCLSFRPKKR